MNGARIARSVRWDRPWIVEPGEPDQRPFLVLAALLLVLAAALAVPASRAWLADEVAAPLHAQVDPAAARGATGYTVASLLLWAALGGALAWAAYEIVFHRLRLEPDRRFFAALAPYLVFGPLLHALLVADALGTRGPLAYLAAEPPVYLTTAALALLGFAAGAALGRPHAGAAAVGVVALLPLLALATGAADADEARRAGILLLVAAAATAVVAGAYHAVARREPLPAVAAVVGAHALDGTTTWMVLRDPLGLGFRSFAEKNPISLALVEISNGWPYFAVKLALPVLLLTAIRVEPGQERLHAFLLLAVFVLGYGPGMSNLLQVLLG